MEKILDTQGVYSRQDDSIKAGDGKKDIQNYINTLFMIIERFANED